MVSIWCSASDRIRVPARPAQHVHRRVPHLQRRTRRSVSTIGDGTPDMTIGRAAAVQAGARPYLHRCAGTRSTGLDHQAVSTGGEPMSNDLAPPVGGAHLVIGSLTVQRDRFN